MKTVFLMMLVNFTLLEGLSAEEIYPVSIKSGNFHNCVLFSNDQLKCWGANYHGQLGHNQNQMIGNLPNQMGNNLPFLPEKVSHFALGIFHTCIVTKTNNLKCWGNLKENLDISAEITRQGGVFKLVAGDQYSCLLFNSGKLKCWGFNYLGRFGTGEGMGGKIPYSSANYWFSNRKIVDVSTYKNTCVLTVKNEAFCLGSNNMGSLGQGTDVDSIASTDNLNPIRHGATSQIEHIYSAHSRSCLLFVDGMLKCFGLNDEGALGIESNKRSVGLLPEEMGANLKAALNGGSAKVRILTQGNNTCILYEKSGILKCFGSNEHRQLGLIHKDNVGNRPNSMGDKLEPIDPGELGRVVDFSVGQDHVCALLEFARDSNPANLKVKCWGDGTYGALGRDDLVNYENDFELMPATNSPVDLL